MSDVTRILVAIEGGDRQAAAELLPLVYEELRRLARAKLARERPGQTLQATALVHEAYLRLVGNADPGWTSRGHFFGAAARAMRRILVDEARRKGSEKRGGERERMGLEEAEAFAPMANQDLVALDEALRGLESEDAIKARLVELRFFGGLSVAEAACALGISEATAKRYWRYAKAWLHREMSGEGDAARGAAEDL
jgi:RNA polymerase sigma factor (TIGR02999 family)